MDKYIKDERRRERIQKLIDEQCGGVIAEFARRIKKDCSYVGRMLYPMGKPGKRGITVHTIDAIEAAFGLPHGWLDGIELPDEYLAAITQLWPHLELYKRRALAAMARELSDYPEKKETECQHESAPPGRRTHGERRSKLRPTSERREIPAPPHMRPPENNAS